MAKRLKRAEVDDRVRVAYQLRKMIGADRKFFYQMIWLWPAPPAPVYDGPPLYGPLTVEHVTQTAYKVTLKPTRTVYWWTRFGGVIKLHKQEFHQRYEHLICCICEYDFTVEDRGRPPIDCPSHGICRNCHAKVKGVPNFFGPN